MKRIAYNYNYPTLMIYIVFVFRLLKCIIIYYNGYIFTARLYSLDYTLLQCKYHLQVLYPLSKYKRSTKYTLTYVLTCTSRCISIWNSTFKQFFIFLKQVIYISEMSPLVITSLLDII